MSVDSPKTVRCFIAACLNEPTIANLSAYIQTLKVIVTSHRVHWVQPQNMHLTLQFLGDTPVDSIDNICLELQKIVKDVKQFNLALTEVGFFPSKRHPHVIAMNTTIPKALRSLVETLQFNLANLGFVEKRLFKSHITLARCHEDIDTSIVFPLMPMVFPIHQIALFKSTLTKQGSTYEILEKFEL